MKNKILEAGLRTYPNVTITNVANYMGVSKPSVFYYFRANEIKEAVEEYALQVDDKSVIAQMITSKVERVGHLSEKEKMAYLVDSTL